MTRVNKVLAGTLLLPTLFGVLVLWSLGDRQQSTDRVPAAVVNLDKPVTTGQGQDKQVVAAGRLLAAGLTSPRHPDEGSLGWQLTDAGDAQRGLRAGDYYAVVTIPSDFSQRLAGIAGDDPTRAGVTLRTNDASSAVVGEASRQVTTIALARLGHTITSTYLQGLDEQTGKLKGRLGEAANGAGQLAGGTTRLAEGARRLDGGATTLAAGLGDLGRGADRLAGGSRRLAGGAAELHRGTTRLSDGLATLSHGTDPLPGRTRQLADGARQVADGVGPYAALVKDWAQACTLNPTVAATNPRLCAGTIQAAGVGGRNADRLASGADQVASGADRLADGTPQLVRGIDRAAAGADRLDSGTAQLATGSARLATGASRLAEGAGRASDGAGRLADGSADLADGTGRLTSGSGRLASGLREGARQIPAPSEDRASVVANPVSASADSINPTRDGVTLLLPTVLGFALWLGAFVTYLVRQALPAGRLRMAASGTRLAVSGWLPAASIGIAQAALLLGAAVLMGADLSNPAGVAAMALVCAVVFAAVNQAFVAALGQRRGWILSIAFAAVQLVSLGGLVPIDTAPAPLQALNKVLPVARAADAFARLTLGGEVGSLPGDVLVLALWGALAFAITAIAARRAQKVDPGELRPRARPAGVPG